MKYKLELLKLIFKIKKNIDIDINTTKEIFVEDIEKISNKYKLNIEKLDFKNKFKLKKGLLPSILILDNVYYLLTDFNPKKNEYIVKDIKNNKEKILNKFDMLLIFFHNEELSYFKNKSKWFFDILKEEKNKYLKIIYISLFINIFILIIPLYMMSIYDRIIPAEGYSSLISLTIGVVLIIIFDYIFKVIRFEIIHDISNTINKKMESILYQKIIKVKKNYDKESLGNKFNFFKEINVINDFFSNAIVISLLELPFYFIGIVFISLLSKTLVFVILFFTLIMFLSNYIIQLKLNNIYETLHLKEKMKTNFLIESLFNKDTIIFQNILDTKLTENRTIIDEQEFINEKIILLKNKFNTFLSSVLQLTTIFIMFFGVFEVLNNTMSIGYLIAIAILTSRVMLPIMNINMNYIKLSDVKKSFKIINNFMELPEIDLKNKLFIQNFKGQFKIKNMSFKYDNNFIFDNVSLEINSNDKLGIISENSKGKTTLFNLITGVIEPLHGEILIDNHNISKINLEEYLKNISVLEENPSFFKGTLYENIDLEGKYTIDTLYEKIVSLKLDNLIGNNKDILSVQIEEFGKNLSPGNLQIIAIIRTLIKDKDIIILDEPTKNLDPNREKIVKQILFEYCKEKTLILFTNKINMLEIVKNVSVLQKNEIKKISVQEFFGRNKK